MRRSLSSLVLLLLLLPLPGPLFAAGQGTDAGLPACCRRGGKHHCAMRMMAGSEAAKLLTGAGTRLMGPVERCPFSIATAVPAHAHERFALPGEQVLLAAVVSHPAGVTQTECKRRIARDRSRQKRGPPEAISL